jgi:hypothetical protein
VAQRIDFDHSEGRITLEPCAAAGLGLDEKLVARGEQVL